MSAMRIAGYTSMWLSLLSMKLYVAGSGAHVRTAAGICHVHLVQVTCALRVLGLIVRADIITKSSLSLEVHVV